MSIRLFPALLGVLGVWSLAMGQQAVVTGIANADAEIGQAWILKHGDDCLAVLPTHVASEAGSARFLGEGGRHRAELDQLVDMGDDVSLASMRGSLGSNCQTTTGSLSRNVARILSRHGVGTLRSLNGDATRARLSVAVVDDDGEMFLRIKPTSDSDSIRKGHSGSLLMFGDEPVGMLLSVSTRTGVGTVVRVDTLVRKLESHLGLDAQSSLSTAHSGSGASTEQSWEITSWNTHAAPISSSPTELTLDGDREPWRAADARWPVTFEMTRTSGVGWFSGISIHASPTSLAEQRPQTLQLLVSVSSAQPKWRSIHYAGLDYVDNIATVRLPATRVRQLRIELHGNPSETGAATLHKLMILD